MTIETDQLEKVQIEGEDFFRISNVDSMRPFLMSIVSDSNHWMFISSNGGLSAGRKDAENALFPYYTDDKLTESYDITGSKSIFWVTRDGKSSIWEPFSERFSGTTNYSRNLYKNLYSNKVLFEEVNHDLGLTFRYEWASSDRYGFIKTSFLINDSENEVNVRLLDGIQNIMPCGITADFQIIRSNLADAYKRNELEEDTGLGIYALSAIIVDKAEPSEALKANIAWSIGLDNPTYLLSSSQLDTFRKGEELQQETDMKAQKGAYFVSQQLTLTPKEQKDWIIVANVNQTATSIGEVSKWIRSENNLPALIKNDIDLGSQSLVKLVSSSDGFQTSADKMSNARHYSNTLFNIMRGGIFDYNYQIEKWDFDDYLKKANIEAYQSSKSLLDQLSDTFTLQELRALTSKTEDKDFTRLAFEYMPLKFSRRHGDPSRPWNKFSINTKNEFDGSKILDYEGNWRDIFQNWEALAHAYPEFIESMIFKFLNASTFDGYNPYRVTKDGFDWEVVEEHDPWSYIGYWGDHQIIYLLKFLEFIEDYYPGRLASFFDQNLFVYANVPYKIKPYEDILKNPKDTIVFDDDLDRSVRAKRSGQGSDGALLADATGNIHRVNLLEKILATALAKLSNFIPDGGIWLNTQRPEWNDANNALVGNGVSMVTLYYLRRFLNFFQQVLQSYSGEKQVETSTELFELFNGIRNTLTENQSLLSGEKSNKQRKKVVDDLGIAGSNYRNSIYKNQHSGEKSSLNVDDVLEFITLAIKFLDNSIEVNKRHDNMYHAYNIMTVENANEISVSHLDEMLEGQVGALSSGCLSSTECLELLDALKQSKLFRKDQFSYLLYPNKELPQFLNKNVIPEEKVKSSPLLQQLLEDGNTQVIEKDVNGKYHFNGNFNNSGSLQVALEELSENGFDELVQNDQGRVLEVFEDVFNHKAFTGRSGTFYGYEGLGSIYWHMVSKLLLAVEECCLKAINDQESSEIVGRLLEHFYEINEGIGVHKSPEHYGAYPIDPYSHTPTGKGAQQPGMTGQVKEDILTRMGELGILVKNGQLQFNPCLLRASEFLKNDEAFDYIDINQNKKTILLNENTLAFTYCQIPVIYSISEKDSVDVLFSDGSSKIFDELKLDKNISQEVFVRTGAIESIKVEIKKSYLK